MTDPHTGTLTAVSALASNDVWTVGWFYDQLEGRYRPLVEHGDGIQFTATVAPSATNGYNAFNGVGAISDTDVWAVGYHTPLYYTYEHSPLIEHFDGSAWRVVKSPYGGTGDLNSVLAFATNDVWAVGTRTINPYGSLLLHWNGVTWSVIDDGHTADNTFLYSSAGVASSDLWVGGSTVEGSNNVAFAEHWDGTTWTAHLALPGAGYDEFNAIAVDRSTSQLQGVGWQTSGLGYYQMAQRYDGSVWTLERPPDMPANNNLYGVTVLGGKTWASGYGSTPGLNPMIERWNGTTWRPEKLPVSGYVTIYAITGVGRTLFAVGDSVILTRTT